MRSSVLRAIPALFYRRSARARAPGPNRRLRARAAVALVLPAFALVLVGAWGAAESAVPEITDTDYHVRLRLIRAAAAEHPQRPLGIVLGSSRMAWAFAPEQLPEGDGVYWVSAAHVGAGPVLNRILLHRLLRDGVRPAVVALEVMPAFFVKENNRFTSSFFARTDLPLIRPYADRPFDYDYHFLRHRFTRLSDLARVGDPFAGHPEPFPRGGSRLLEDDVAPTERARRTAVAKRMYGAYVGSMVVRPGADRLFRDTLREAAANEIRVVLVYAPEGPTFRSWYDPAGLEHFDRYIAGAAAEFGAPVVDARFWLEEEDFSDSHHVLKRGANKFTARFARAVPAVLPGR
jgi:hypothetical protein